MPAHLRQFGSKLLPPSRAIDHIARTAQCERIVEAGRVRLVLIQAPAGFGKTATMREAFDSLSARGVACAWITLDVADNDPSRFLGCLDAAISAIALDEVSLARDDHASVADMAVAAIDQLAATHTPFALFLDEFEALAESSVLAIVRELIHQLPECGRVVVGSRTVPQLRLGRLRARGELVEIGPEALRFSETEARRFLAAKAQTLGPDDRERLRETTEGWPAVLRLACAALARHADPSAFVARFSGSDRDVGAFLADEVCAQLTEPQFEFLLATSILRDLEPALCNALVGGVDSEAMLADLARANVLVTPLDGLSRGWRYHSIFADYLRQELARRNADFASLHRRASHWYEANERPVPAIDHALLAGDTDRAVTLLNGVAQAYLEHGRVRLVARWLDALGESALESEPRLTICRLFAVCFTRGAAEARELLERSGVEAHPDPEIAAEARCVRPLVLSMLDDFDAALAAGRTALVAPRSRSIYAETVLLNCMAYTFSVVGDDDAARRSLQTTRTMLDGDSNVFNVMYAESVEGLIDLHAGRLREAKARFRLAMSAAQSEVRGARHTNAWAAIFHAAALYEANELATAARLLHLHLPLARDVGLPDGMILGHAMLSRIAFDAGDIDEAFSLLAELEQFGYRRRLPRVEASAQLERAQLLMRQSKLGAAEDQLARADDRALWTPLKSRRLIAHDLQTPTLTRIRLDLAAGRFREAGEAIAAEKADAEARRFERRLLLLRLLEAASLSGLGRAEAAARSCDDALKECAREGYVRLVIDEAPVIGTLVLARARVGIGGGLARHEPLLAAYLKDLIGLISPAGPEVAPDGDSAPLDPLTPKELQILALLADGYSNAAMAEKLFVSDSTVRTHLRNINSKLDTRSRTQAIAVARRLQLIA